MRKRIVAVGVLGVVIFSSAIAFLMAAQADDRFLDETALTDWRSCHQSALVDIDGRPIVGPEDVVFDRRSRSFLLAAFDRKDPTKGGLYRLSEENLLRSERPLVANRVTDASFDDLRPHGVDLAQTLKGLRFAAIHREDAETPAERSVIVTYAFEEQRWRETSRLTDARLCRSNDIAITPDGRALVTLDRGVCGGWRMAMENIFAPPNGAVAAIGSVISSPIPSGLLVPNGIAIQFDGNGEAWTAIAETRRRQIRWFALYGILADHGAPLAAIAYTPLDGAPDNLTPLADGSVLAATHDSLFQLALHRTFRGVFAPPSGAVWRISEPLGHQAKLVVAVPGDMLAGPTAAAIGERSMIIGSATEAAIMVCPKPIFP